MGKHNHNNRHRYRGERRFSPEETRLWELYQAKRTQLIQRFGSRCCVCNRTNDKLEFHHMRHHEEYGKYGKSAPLWRRYQALGEIEKYPNDFVLLCYGCHQTITWLRELVEEERFRLHAIVTATF